MYQFPHRSFQEYLAACHLARFDFPDTLSRLVKTDPNRWREVTLLAAARFKDAPSSIWELVEELCAKDDAPLRDARPSRAARPSGAPCWPGRCWLRPGWPRTTPTSRNGTSASASGCATGRCGCCAARVLPARERALAGDLLARLGDTRQHLLDVDHMRFSVVPAGPFWMGDEGDEDATLHRN